MYRCRNLPLFRYSREGASILLMRQPLLGKKLHSFLRKTTSIWDTASEDARCPSYRDGIQISRVKLSKKNKNNYEKST